MAAHALLLGPEAVVTGTPKTVGDPQGTYGLFDRTDLDTLSVTNNQPTTMLSQSIPYADLNDFEELFFNYVYIIPSTLSVPSVAADSFYTVTLWNAFRTTKTLDSLTEAGFDGISVNAAPALPLAMSPLGLYDFTLLIEASGPPTIDASLSFNVGSGELTAVLPIVGQRVGEFYFIPNWETPVTRHFGFLTDISRSRTGRERRRSLRSRPRVKIEYMHSAIPSRLRRLLKFTAGDISQRLAMPDWVSRTRLATTVGLGGTSFDVESVPGWLVTGATVYLVGPSKTSYNLTSVADVTGTTVTLVGPTIAEFVAGSSLYRGLVGRLEKDVVLRKRTNEVAELQITFDVDPGEENLADTVAAGTIFQGRELFPFKPNWSQEPNITFARERETFDVGRGRILSETFETMTKEITEMTFLGRDIDEITEIEDFFRRHEGRLGEFWLASGSPDILPTDDIANGANFLTTEYEMYDLFNGSVDHVAVQVVLKSGTVYNMSILAMNQLTLPDRTEIVFNETFGEDIAIADIERISWMKVCRFATDTLTITWQTNSVGQAQLSTQSLEAETPE